MIVNTGEFNEVWKTIHEIDREAPIHITARSLLNKFFNQRYHKLDRIKQLSPDHWEGQCKRCNTKIYIKIRKCGDISINYFSIGTELGNYLVFKMSNMFGGAAFSDVTMTHNRIIYCKKIECLL